MAARRCRSSATGTLMSEAILAISAKGFGCVGVTDKEGCLVGIVTDGDLRRHICPSLPACRSTM